MTTGGWPSGLATDLKISILFCTRLPLARAAPIESGDVARASWAFPLVGALVGGVGALAYGLALEVGLPAAPASGLALAATLVMTGCLHEDGLADTVDGFGGGRYRERKLDIMRDSRLGTYGVCALTLSILLRASALASLGAPALVVPALIAAHGTARAVVPAFMFFLPPARSDGLSAGAGQPPGESVTAAVLLGLLMLVLCLGLWPGRAALILLAIVAARVAWLSVSQIDGQTGDVLGAVEQAGEIVILLVALG